MKNPKGDSKPTVTSGHTAKPTTSTARELNLYSGIRELQRRTGAKSGDSKPFQHNRELEIQRQIEDIKDSLGKKASDTPHP